MLPIRPILTDRTKSREMSLGTQFYKEFDASFTEKDVQVNVYSSDGSEEDFSNV